jgi:DNA-binding response OmpR family regulator
MTRPVSSPHILVIDDAPQILALFRALLHRAGYRVSTDRFASATEPLMEAIKALHPDLIILDLIIREERRGWRLLEVLKLDRETRQIPVIVSSAAVELVGDLQPHLEELGARVVLRPFHIDHLVAVTDTALGRPRTGATGKQRRRRQAANNRRGVTDAQASRDTSAQR